MFVFGVIVGGVIFGCIGFVTGKVYGSGAMRKAVDSLKEEVKDIG